MRLSDRHLGYLVIAGIFSVLFLIWAAQRNNREPEPDQKVPAPSPSPSQPSARADIPQVPHDLCQQVSLYIAKMKDAALLDYYISPDGLDSLVFVEPQIWRSFTHQEKLIFVQMFIDFFLCHNQDHPGSKPVAFFAVRNMTTRERLARGWLIDGGEGCPPGTAEVFK